RLRPHDAALGRGLVLARPKLALLRPRPRPGTRRAAVVVRRTRHRPGCGHESALPLPRHGVEPASGGARRTPPVPRGGARARTAHPRRVRRADPAPQGGEARYPAGLTAGTRRTPATTSSTSRRATEPNTPAAPPPSIA